MLLNTEIRDEDASYSQTADRQLDDLGDAIQLSPIKLKPTMKRKADQAEQDQRDVNAAAILSILYASETDGGLSDAQLSVLAPFHSFCSDRLCAFRESLIEDVVQEEGFPKLCHRVKKLWKARLLASARDEIFST